MTMILLLQHVRFEDGDGCVTKNGQSQSSVELRKSVYFRIVVIYVMIVQSSNHAPVFALCYWFVCLVKCIGVFARGSGGLPPDLGKAIIFRAQAKFFGQQPAANSEKKLYILRLLNEETEFIPSSEIKCPKSGIFWFTSASLANPYCQSTWMCVCMFVCMYVCMYVCPSF